MVSTPTHRKGFKADEDAALPGKPSAFKRLGSVITSWSSTTSLLRHSSIGSTFHPTGTWQTGCCYVVSTVGSPFLLGLPLAVSQLGWAAGMIILVLAYPAMLYTATILARLHEYGGKRHTRYRELGQAVFGKKRGLYLILPFQTIVNIGMCVSYPIVAGQSLHGICMSLAGEGGCHVSQSWWIAIFCATHLGLVLFPDISSLLWVNILGAATSVGFSVLAAVGAAMAGRAPGVVYSLQGSPANQVFNAFTSLGAITLLYGNTVIVETHSTIRAEQGSAVEPMVKALRLGYTLVVALLVAVVATGYWAFGAAVQPIVFGSIGTPTWLVVAGYVMVVLNSLPGYLMFAHNLFDWVDLKIMLSHWTGLEFQGGLLLILKRFSFRWAFVVVTAALAVCLPFFLDLMGLLGAIGYSPLCFIIPCLLWLKTQEGLAWYEKGLCWTLILVFSLVGVAAGTGAVRSLIVHSSSYQFFS